MQNIFEEGVAEPQVTAPAEPVVPEPAAPQPPSQQSGSDLFSVDSSGVPSVSVETGAVGATPVARQVQANETVQGQLENIYNPNDPVQRRVGEAARSAFEARGLKNSSFAEQAAQNAIYGQATNIAAYDAGVYERAAAANNQFQNQFNLQEASHQQLMDRAEQTFGHQQQLSEQAFSQQSQLSAQGFQQALDLSIQDFSESSQLLAQELTNQLQLSAQDQQELLQTMQTEQLNVLARLGEQARLDAIQSGLDQTEALELEDLRNRLAINRDDNAARARLEEIAAQADAQSVLSAEQDSRRMQMQYLAETGTVMRQSMQVIGQINSTEGLTAQQQASAVADVRRQLENDLASLRAYYSQSPSWDPAWGQPSGGDSGAPLPANPVPGPGGIPATPILPGANPATGTPNWSQMTPDQIQQYVRNNLSSFTF